MREDRRKRYDDEFRHEALGLIKAGMGKHSLARWLAMPVQTAEKWIMKYRSNGEDAVMGAKGKRSYDWETKVAAARDHVDNDMAKTEVMAKYAIASVAPLERWCRKYRTDGPEALRPKPKGRPRGAKSSLEPKPTRVQELAEEVACLCSMFLQQVRQRFESIVTVPGPVGLHPAPVARVEHGRRQREHVVEVRLEQVPDRHVLAVVDAARDLVVVDAARDLVVVVGMLRVGHRRPPISCQSSLIGLSNTL